MKKSELTKEAKKTKNSKNTKNKNVGSDTSEKKTSRINSGKCCSCQYYPGHKNGIAVMCSKINKYVARKNTACKFYK